MVSGTATGDAPVSYWLNSSPVPINNPQVFAKVNLAQFPLIFLRRLTLRLVCNQSDSPHEQLLEWCSSL